MRLIEQLELRWLYWQLRQLERLERLIDRYLAWVRRDRGPGH